MNITRTTRTSFRIALMMAAVTALSGCEQFWAMMLAKNAENRKARANVTAVATMPIGQSSSGAFDENGNFIPSPGPNINLDDIGQTASREAVNAGIQQGVTGQITGGLLGGATLVPDMTPPPPTLD